MKIKKVGEDNNSENISERANDDGAQKVISPELKNAINEKPPVSKSSGNIKFFIFGGIFLVFIAAAVLIYYFVIDKNDGVKVVNSQNSDKSADIKQKELELKEKELELKQKELDGMQSGNNNSSSQNTGVSKEPGKSSEASNQVSTWINALGSREYSTAFYLMAPAIRGTYSKFSSKSGYGGITRTKVISCETTGISGCSFEVTATYESFDPYNKDGKYTQLFTVNDCKGYWEISVIKNISINYY